MDFKFTARFPVAILLIVASCQTLVQGFSDGSKFARGSAATRKIYCNRPPSKRGPLHFSPECNGFCNPSRDFDRFYTMNVSSSTYWLDMVRVNITTNPDYDKSLTGFSIYAIDETGFVAGSFVEDDTDVIVGTCNDVITITDETHAGFHRKADRNRKEVSLQWQPDGYNHQKVKFVLWVVNNHSDIYFIESQWLTSKRNGSNILDVVTSLKKILSAVNIDLFENSFRYRSTKGYQLDLANPFSVFANSPKFHELAPADSRRSNVGSTGKSVPSNSGQISPVAVSTPGSGSTPSVGSFQTNSADSENKLQNSSSSDASSNSSTLDSSNNFATNNIQAQVKNGVAMEGTPDSKDVPTLSGTNLMNLGTSTPGWNTTTAMGTGIGLSTGFSNQEGTSTQSNNQGTFSTGINDRGISSPQPSNQGSLSNVFNSQGGISTDSNRMGISTESNTQGGRATVTELKGQGGSASGPSSQAVPAESANNNTDTFLSATDANGTLSTPTANTAIYSSTSDSSTTSATSSTSAKTSGVDSFF